jgi:hypothetical protein
MPHTDTMDKVVFSYLAAVCAKDFSYECDGKMTMVRRKPLQVSPTIFRGYTCPPRCGACCQRFSLVYLPDEFHPYPLKAREVRVDGRPVTLFEDPQRDHQRRYCRNLDKTGRCGIHGQHPFSCDFELIRIHMSNDSVRMGLQLYGRAWAMKRVDGDRGALCEITDATKETMLDSGRKLRRLHDWACHLGVTTHLKEIIEWVESGPHKEALRL